MPRPKFMDVLKSTINEIQQQNQANPREETADPSVFDLLKQKIRMAEEKGRVRRANKGKSPQSILDVLREKIDEAQAENAADNNVKTAPPAVFEKVKKKVEEKEKRRMRASVRTIIEDYDLDINEVRALGKEALKKVQASYRNDSKRLDARYAEVLQKLIDAGNRPKSAKVTRNVEEEAEEMTFEV